MTNVVRETLMKDLGINSWLVFTHLKSVDLSSSFPYDAMHLLFENLVLNMIKHWTGGFKWLDQGNGTYEMSPATWKTLGRLTTEATQTILSAFVSTIPNIAEDLKLFKAEANMFWFQYMALSLLKGILTRRYYNHFIKAREIIIQVTKFSITNTEINELQTMINDWVNGYELQTGPLWASWAFVMEQFCGYLLPAIKNHTKPYEMIDNFVSREVQMKIITRVFNLPVMGRPRVQTRVMCGVEISSCETMHEEFD
ncbi:hypothetical protein FRC10_001643 [Ceratobasidium sp. 414]|nr:hypothetical protein FRC10_001643 [Ceratobasidium sp. 414]